MMSFTLIEYFYHEMRTIFQANTQIDDLLTLGDLEIYIFNLNDISHKQDIHKLSFDTIHKWTRVELITWQALSFALPHKSARFHENNYYIEIAL